MTANPAPGPARAALALQINALPEARADLLVEVRDAKDAGVGGGMNMNVGDNNMFVVQNDGSNNTFTNGR